MIYLVLSLIQGSIDLQILQEEDFQRKKWNGFALLDQGRIVKPDNFSTGFRWFIQWLWNHGYQNPLEIIWTTDFLKRNPPVPDRRPAELTVGSVAGIPTPEPDPIQDQKRKIMTSLAQLVISPPSPQPEEKVAFACPVPEGEGEVGFGHNVPGHSADQQCLIWLPVTNLDGLIVGWSPMPIGNPVTMEV